MRKLMKLMPLLLMGMLATALSGCEGDNKPDLKSNYDRKMTAVTQEVKTTKSTDKALLLVSFGSTWDAPQQSFKELVKSFKAKFPDRDVYFSFTSEICMTRCAQKGWNYYAPQFYMEALGNAGYKDIAVQSLHVIPGEEYLRVQNCLKDFHNHSVEGGKTPFADVTVYLAGPLLYEEVDCDKVAAELHKLFGKEVKAGKLVCFMGHGNPADMNYGNGNSRYIMIEQALQKLDKHYFVATVDMEGNYVGEMLGRMKDAGFTSGEVILHPLMSIAGDHANNDLKGGVETPAEEGSWRAEMVKAGYTCSLENCIMKGLSDYPGIANVWISHMQQALKEAPMYPEKED